MANEPASSSQQLLTLPEFRRLADWVRTASPGAAAPAETATVESPAAWRRRLRALLHAAAQAGLIDEAAPADQPSSVQPIAGKLFAAYHVDGGHLQLAGCQLEDHLVSRCTWSDGRVSYHSGDGQPLSAEVVAAIQMEHLEARDATNELNVDEAGRAIEAALEIAEHDGGEVQHLTLIECRYVSGKVRVTIGNASWDLPFHGWAGAFVPPAFVCPHTGRATFHISATDDGRIVAAEEIATCRRTGRRLLRNELAHCAVTGAYVLREYAVQCPVTGELVEQGVFVECRNCRQLVSPHAIQEGVCAACRNLAAIGALDPRLQRVLAAHPGLASWRNWRFAETADVLILEAQGLWQRLLAVLDRQTLHCRHMALAQRWPGKWRDLSAEQAREVLAHRH